MSIQGAWNECLQCESCLTYSSSSKSDKQTTHSVSGASEFLIPFLYLNVEAEYGLRFIETLFFCSAGLADPGCESQLWDTRHPIITRVYTANAMVIVPNVTMPYQSGDMAAYFLAYEKDFRRLLEGLTECWVKFAKAVIGPGFAPRVLVAENISHPNQRDLLRA